MRSLIFAWVIAALFIGYIAFKGIQDIDGRCDNVKQQQPSKDYIVKGD